MKLRRTIEFLLILLCLAGCVKRIEIPVEKPIEVPKPALSLMKPEKLIPVVDDLDRESLLAAIEKSLRYYDGISGNTSFLLGGRNVTLRELKESLAAFREIIHGSEADEIRWNKILDTFDVYRASGFDENGTVLFTGYFEPILEGSLEETQEYRYPIYRAPDDTVVVHLGKFNRKYRNEKIVGRLEDGELVPYFTRQDIEDGGLLKGREFELAWVKDPVALFFLHIQGSGKITLPGGDFLQVSYAHSNGRPYRSIGKYLIEKGKLSPGEVTHSAIKKYLTEHPLELSEILNYNESYIFFRIVEKGPVGALGLSLTAGRSIATDLDLFPRGAVAFIRLRKPVFDDEGNIKAWKSFSRFVLNHDTGGVIKGPGRVDLFCGTGSDAELLAGSLKEKGELYFLLKKR
jgi:membrane-bound lytic murein transglycosylase A